MSIPVRCFTTNTAIGQYSTAYTALRDYFNNNPPKDGEKQMVDYFSEFGLIWYPQRMRIISNVTFKDAHLLSDPPQKDM